MRPIIQEKSNTSNTTSLSFFFPSGVDMRAIPRPSGIYALNTGFIVVYLLKGDFTTLKSSRYYSDAINRFLLTFDAEYNDILPNRVFDAGCSKSYDLKEITKELKSLKARFKTSLFADKFEDEAFWTMKIYVEDSLRKGGMISQRELEVFLINEFGQKERSTLKAKAKAVYNWYAKRNFKPTMRIHKMSRAENAKKIAEKKAERMKASIIGVVESFKFLNEKITAKNIAEYLKCSRTTATKYLKELKEEGRV